MSAPAAAPVAPAGPAQPAPARQSLPELVRERRDVGLAVAVALVIALAVGLGLGLSGGSAAPPDRGAAQLVPAGALAYLNVSLDRQRPGFARTLKLASTLPGFSLARSLVRARVGALFGSATGTPAWVGDEAALAVVPSAGSRAGSLVLFAVRSPVRARRYLAGVPASTSVFYRGVELRKLSGGSYVALLGRYLVAGQEASLRQAVDVFRGASALASVSAYRQATSTEPPGRVLDLYAPGSGLTALLASRGGLLGAVRALLAAPGLSAVSASLSAAPGGLRLQVHRVFAAGSGAGAGTGVNPSLLGRLPADTAFAAELPDLSSAPRLLAASSELGVGSAIGPLLTRLGLALRAEGFDLSGVLGVFSHPTVVAVTGASGRPDLLILTRTSHPAQARIALADLDPSLAALFPASSSGPGVAPLFTGRQIDGMTIHQLQLGAGLQVNYTLYHHLVAISTSVTALTALTRRSSSLGASSALATALGPSGTGAGSLVFANLKVLIRLGEQTGLLHGSVFARLAPDLDRISVVGLRATSDKTESTSELYFHIP